MRPVLTFGLLLFACVSAQAQAGKPTDTATASTNALEQHLIDLNTKWAAAEMKGDTAAINKILAPDVSHLLCQRWVEPECQRRFGGAVVVSCQELARICHNIHHSGQAMLFLDCRHRTAPVAWYPISKKADEAWA